MKDNLEQLKGRIMPGGKAMILAYDQGFEHGPRDFMDNPESTDFGYILDIAEKGRFTAIVAHAGLAEKYRAKIQKAGVALILKLNGKSELYTEDDPYSPQLYSVEDALDLGATAVGYTVYSGSKYEDQMNVEFAGIIREAHSRGVPAIGWMYPRGRGLMEKKSTAKTLKIALNEQAKANSQGISKDIDEAPSIVAYGARIGMELGADIVKVKYTGSVESFRWVVQSASPTRVVMSGGPKTETDDDFLSMVKNVVAAGAAGIAVGRNVWQRKDPLVISEKIRKVIFGT